MIDWSKMTKKKYDKILKSKEILRKEKSKLSLLLVETKSYENYEEFDKIIKKIKNLIKQSNKIEETLNDFIL